MAREWLVGLLVTSAVVFLAGGLLTSDASSVRWAVAMGLGIGLLANVPIWWWALERGRNLDKAKLEIVWENKSPFIGNQDYYRVGIKNHGPATAENVVVTLDSIDPDPLADRILPAPIGEKGGYCRKVEMRCDVPADRDHYFDVFRGLNRGVQNLLWELQTVERPDAPFMMRDDQEYVFSLSATAANQSEPALAGLYVNQDENLHLSVRLEKERTAGELAKSHARQAIEALDHQIAEGQSILDSCGRPGDQMDGAGPLYFQQTCLPWINKFGAECRNVIGRLAPEFLGEFGNIGNVTHNTDVKAASI